MKHALLLILALLTPIPALAQPDPRLTMLETVLNRVQLEQQAVYQQFLMAQELRRNEMQQQATPMVPQRYPMGMESSSLINYDENVRQQKERSERLHRYDSDIARAYSRHQELGEQKKALLDQIMELAQQPKR
ncbi:MAG TPA: hypothetical protein VFY24_09605 [Azospira sp.]|nr:hypothetical protein [Azospira sp.]